MRARVLLAVTLVGIGSMGLASRAASQVPAVGGCAQPHYLLGLHPDGTQAFNRFEWWSKVAPLSGPLTVNGTVDTTFECELFTGLTTVVGAEVALGTGSSNLRGLGYGAIGWDERDASGQYAVRGLEELPGVELAVRSARPGSAPVLEEVTLPSGQRKRLLVNRTAPGYTVPAGRFRPSLWIDFALPQRAVGIEYGYVELREQPNNRIRPTGVRLVAYDGRGAVVAEANGGLLDRSTGRRLEPNVVNHRIGVRDALGRIASVELRFEEDDPEEPGNPILEPQAIYRIWHEPLPPAAVLQGAIALGNAPANPDGATPIARDAATHRLPFRLDRALVLLRGVKLAFRDGKAHEVARWRARLAAPGTYAVAPGGSIRVSADAFLLPSADNSGLANDALVYYSVLAWDSTQTELFTGAIEGAMESPDDDGVGGVLETRDPCPVPVVSTTTDRATYRTDAEARCGPLFVAPRHLFQSSYWSFNDQEYDEIYLEVGDYFFDTLVRGPGPRPSLFNEDRRVQWGVSGAFDGDGKEGMWQEVGGNVLTGRSLRVGPDPHSNTAAVGLSYLRDLAVLLPDVGPRPPRGAQGHWTQPWSDLRSIGRSYPVFGAMAVVGMRRLHALPEGPLRELEVEVEGAYYDGEIVDWQYGAGVATDASGSNQRLVYANPSFAAVRRTSAFAAPQLDARPALECQGVVGLGPTWCDNTASVINTGNGHALITEVAPGTHPEDARFAYSFIWRGQRLYDLAALRDRLPLQLRPGESLLVSARYTPEARPDGRERFLDVGFLNLRTPIPTLHATVTANGHGRMPDPAGVWMPAELTLSAAAPAQTAALCPTGTTALVIDWNAPTGGLYFDPPAAGFSAAPAPNQPDECLAVIVSHPSPQSAAGAEATLFAATNAGPIALPVRFAGN